MTDSGGLNSRKIGLRVAACVRKGRMTEDYLMRTQEFRQSRNNRQLLSRAEIRREGSVAISVATVFRNTLSTPVLWIVSREFENKLPCVCGQCAIARYRLH